LYKFGLLDVQLFMVSTRSVCDQPTPAFMAVLLAKLWHHCVSLRFENVYPLDCPRHVDQQSPYNPDAVCCRRNVP